MMSYSTFVPISSLQDYVECYWIVEGTDQTEQKIIPDGFSEMIFHYHDPYVISTEKICERQSLSLVAGQLDAPIFLKPTGKSGVLGVKFKPTGMWKLFGFQMNELKNFAVGLENVLDEKIDSISEQFHFAENNLERIQIIEKFLLKKIQSNIRCVTDEILSTIHRAKGTIPVHALANEYKISVRKLERLFFQHVGISAKLYSRLVRFNNVFALLQSPQLSKSDVTYLAGYFDQAHFNKEFREFSGENPDSWIRQNHAFANFFMSR